MYIEAAQIASIKFTGPEPHPILDGDGEETGVSPGESLYTRVDLE
jgi:hypothetical protein